MRAWLVVIALLMAGCRIVVGEDLHFDEPDQHFKPLANAEDVYAMYRFSNRGKKPLTITTVRPTCGCTTTTLEKTTYQPGESGEIMVDFSIGDHSGEQDKVIEVYHDSAPPQLLHLRVELPPAPAIEPGFVSWKRHDDRAAKVVSITLPPGSPYSFVAAVPSSPLVVAELTPTVPGQWTLRVTPTSTSAPGNAMVELRTTAARKFYVFASVADDATH
jgi:hypothetical protein